MKTRSKKKFKLANFRRVKIIFLFIHKWYVRQRNVFYDPRSTFSALGKRFLSLLREVYHVF